MKRVEWIDSLKGFGIFCVTFGHLSCNFLVETHIYSFHMFLFFFLSGYLDNNSHLNFQQFITKKTNALFIPFLFWNIASFFAGLILNVPLKESVTKFLLLDGTICWNAPIWFLLLLYFVEIVFFLLDKYIPKGIYISIPVLLLLWIFASSPNIFLKLNILPVCLIFYIFGNIFYRLYDNKSLENKITRGNKICLTLFFLCASLLFGTYLNPRISFTGAFFGNVIYCILGAIGGVLFYVAIFRQFRFLRTNRVLSYLGKNSLIIMATQYWLFNIFDAITEKLFKINICQYRNTFKAFIMAFITIAIVCVAVEVMKIISKKSLIAKKLCNWAGINIR